MKLLCANDVAMALAIKANTLRIERQWSTRFEEYYWTVSDQHGLIEVFDTDRAAHETVEAIKARL